MPARKKTSNRHRNRPRHPWTCRTCQRSGHGWKMARLYASRAMISSDIRRKPRMVQVVRQRDKHPSATLSGSGRASRFWLGTVRRAPKSLRPTSPRRLGGPTATCRRPRHLLSPKALVPGNDATGFVRRRRRVTHPPQISPRQSAANTHTEPPCGTSGNSHGRSMFSRACMRAASTPHPD